MKTKLSALVISMFAAVSAFAAGDIYEIRPCTENGINTTPYATYDNPLGSGTSNIYFNVRLKLRGDGNNPNRERLKRKYTLEYWDPMAEYQEIFDAVQNPLKIGIYVSGKLRTASLQSVIPNELSGTNFFDCVFMYKPQAGDFALPVRLAVEDESGNVFPADENDSFTTYHFENANLWKVRYYDEDDPSRNGEVVWKFCTDPNTPGGKRPSGGTGYTPLDDYSLKAAGIYVQTVDFDQEVWEAPGEYWREVAMGDELECFLKVDSEATGAIQDSTFYVWSMDETAVKVQSGEPPVEIVTNIASGVEQKATVSIGTITIKGGSVTKNFYIDGIESNKIAKLVLSPWKGFSFGHYTSEILEDYKTIPVKCGPPPVPSVNISFDKDRPTAASAKKLQVNPSTNYLDRASEAVPVYITLSQPYETDMHVNVTVRYEKDAARDPIADKFLSVSQNGDEYSSSDIYYTNVLFKVGETQQTIYVYPLGGNADTKSEGIGFYPVIQEEAPAAVYEAGDRALLQINSLHAPVILLPKSDHDYGTVSGAAGEGFDISLLINDCLRDMENTNGFTVTFGGALKGQPATNIVFTAGEAFDFTVTGYDKKKEGLQIATIKVSEPAEPGMTPKSAIVQVYFTVAVEKDKLVYVSLYDTTAATSLHDGTLFNEGSAPIPMFYVNEPMSAGENLYFFLRPLNDASSNLVSCAAFTQGVELVGGQTNTVRASAFALNFLDGCAITESTGSLEYEIFARTSPKLDEGSASNIYIPAQKLVINVANVFPIQEGFSVGDDPNSVPNGSHYRTPISSSVTNSYAAVVSDVSNIDTTNGIYVVWNFSEGYDFAPSYEYKWTFATNVTVACDHAFETEDATQTVQWVAIDKDMLAALGGIGSLDNLALLWPRIVKMVGQEGIYKVTVYVSNRPYVKLVDEFDSTSITIDEDVDKNDGHVLKVSLSEPAKQRLTLKVTAKTYSDYTDPKLIGELTFNTTTLTIDKGKTVPSGDFKELKYNYHNLDGAPGSVDAGFFVTIDVVAPAALSNYYQRAEAEIFVNNRPPIISPKQGDVVTTNKTVAAGEPFSLEWSAKDERIDMSYGLTARWYIDDMIQNSLTVNNITNNATYVTSNIVINTEGLHEVKLIVSDKDGEDYDGCGERVWLYYIAPTKKLQIRPVGPAGHTESYYDTAAGLGMGRVFADGTRSTVQAFVQTWFYNVEAPQANMYAAGYASAVVPYADDGNLGTGTPKRDLALDPNGEKWTGGAYYEYDGEYDNFFYRWMYVDAEGENGEVASQYSKIDVQTTSGDEVVAPPFKLTPFEAGKLMYETKVVEAIFSRELLKSDNLGDINADGVPDLYTKMYRFGVFDAQGNLIGDDVGLDNVNGWNDGDYLPGSTNLSVKASWGVTNTWSIDALPFDPVMEIRGMDGANSHFNDAYEILAAGIGTGKPMALFGSAMADKVFTMPYYNATTGVQTNDSTLSEVEYVAFTNYCAKMGWDPADESHWGLKDGSYDNSWSPERPTDPTKEDTDGDLLSDGFEYYLWYLAHVGELVNGKLVRRSGSMYNQYDPGRPVEIAPETVERLFDPLTKSIDVNTRDSDNDGLTDLEEFALGTDPINWDTDGDGLPDGYEVHYLQTDPLKYASVGTQCDALMNEDHDAMAWMKFKMHMVAEIILGADGKIVGTNNVYLSESEFATIGDDDTNRYLRVDQGADFLCYTGWVYGVNGPWAIQTPGTTNITAMTNVLVSKDEQVDVIRIHYQVYQKEGFDPRTGWNMKPCKDNHIVNTKDYTALDEFLLQAFYWRNFGIMPADMATQTYAIDGKTNKKSVLELWAKNCTDPNKADTDDDAMPDGWELYVQAPVEASGKNPDPATYGAVCWVSPKVTYSPVGDVDPPTSGDGLLWPEEFAGVESCYRYRDCPTITNPHPEWQNKVWPTDPWANDTDGDGIPDGDELKHFVYGDKVRADEEFDGCLEGGGLNPNFWDTDSDNLPDPFEVEFEGSFTTTDTPASTNVTENADGTLSTNMVEATSTTEWGGGMNGTVNDSMLDYDNDGLNNWQEYMVGTMRCWRYDDTITTWVMHEPDLRRVQAADDEYIYGLIVDPESAHYNPGFRGKHVHPGVYMSWCNNKWDPNYGKFYYLKDGIYHDLKRDALDPALMFQNRWHRQVPFLPPPPFSITKNYPTKYICCDPRNRDTDEDGMDDFYELFHGLNPLYGTVDIVSESWNVPGTIPWSALNNYWTYSVGYTRPDYELRLKGVTNSPFDFFQYPWLAGDPTADPDGDNIRNIYESIMSHMQAESTFLHTDPTPLWMTDMSYPDSLTYRFYYMMDPYWNLGGVAAFLHPTGKFTHTVVDEDGTEHSWTYELNDFPWLHWDADTGICTVNYDINYWSILDTMYSFEQSEGYDTDGDYLGDFEESQGKTKSASNPQDFDDPLRRQAMYFGGKDDPGFLQTSLAFSEQTPGGGIAPEDHMFLYFTVECWAKADASDLNSPDLQTLVERPIWTGAANAADESYLRKNFLIGLKGGRWYTKFDSTGVDRKQGVEITDGPAATTNWTHVAATYDGTALKLYVNGVCCNTHKTSIQPEHGVAAAFHNFGVDPPDDSKRTDVLWADEIGNRAVAYQMISILIGADARTYYGIAPDLAWHERNVMVGEAPYYYNTGAAATWSDYTGFFKGYIDEVRIWDGARPAADILADVKSRKRYTRDDAIANRSKILGEIRGGYGRSPLSTSMLSPELRYHWSFDHVPGAVDPADAAKSPAGFVTSDGMTDGMAVWARPVKADGERWVTPWLLSIDPSIRSSVYSDLAWVPWIRNTVSHLPRMDGLTRDSLFWSENYAGGVPATQNGLPNYDFARTAEAQCSWYQMLYTTPGGVIHSQSYPTYSGDLYEFSMRETHTEGDDLVPFGSAYAKRISATEGGMWDDLGAADAWAETKVDSDHNGLPDWWEQYARQNLSPDLRPWDNFKWDTTVIYNGLPMPAWRAYLRDLARGLLPDGKYHDGTNGTLDYRDTRDLDRDGMPDWWEDMYGIDTGSVADAKADPDNDGLSNYQEYRIEQDSLYMLNPALTRTFVGQVETDYFLQTTNAEGKAVYLGEVYADHDFMEDDVEDVNGYDRTRYDAWADPDEDGWSNFAEMRYAGFKMDTAARFATHYFAATEVKDFPIPVVHATLRYHGDTGTGGATNMIYVEAYSGNNLQKSPSAVYAVTPGSVQSRTIYLGEYSDRVYHGTLTPGHVQAGKDNIQLEGCFIQQNDKWTWLAGQVLNTGTYEEMYRAFCADPTIQVTRQENEWFQLQSMLSSQAILQISVDDKTQKGYLYLDYARVGEIDMITGDFSIDLTPIKTYFMVDTLVTVPQLFFRINYKTMLPTMQNNKLSISLAEPDQGILSEGKTAFVAWMDKDGDGVYTPGVDPIGFAKDVDVGWDQVPAIDIELTDASQAAGQRFSYATASNDTVRVVRIGVNGNTEGIQPRIIFSRSRAAMPRDYVFEGDLVSGGKYGLDWDNLRADLQAMDGIKLKDVTSVEYAVVDGACSMQNLDTNLFITTFSVEYTSEAIKPTAYSPSEKADGIVETVRPTFRWTGADGYTAFRLQIYDAAGSVKLYDSDVQTLPARDSSSRYYWTAPVFIGTNVLNDAWALDNHKSYKWRVAMYNQKFSETTDGASLWSDWATMRAELADTNDKSTLYGTVKTVVKYFGPATNSLDQVVVQLFKNADLTGVPAAQTRLFDVAGDISDLTNGIEVAFHGLEDGDYYACAFIDRNDAETGKGDCVRQRYETWGYSAQVGLGFSNIWNPLGAKAFADSVEIPTVTVYMEDTDINGDDILDWDQDEELLKAASTTAGESALAGDSDGDGLSDFDEGDKSYTKANMWDTDGDGMPDGWEYLFAGTDPLTPDADKVIDGDVMAYAEYASRVITARSTATGAEVTYIIPGTNEYHIGDNVNNEEFYSTYDYNGIYGRGKLVTVKDSEEYVFATVTNTLGGAEYQVIFELDNPVVGIGTNVNEETAWLPATDSSGAYILGAKTNLNVTVLAETNLVTAVVTNDISLGENRVVSINNSATVALVHAQVYDEFGFTQTTAVDPADEHTKPFTALDKYLVIRYLSAIGIGPGEEEVNRKRLWKYYSLIPMVTDGDGLSDLTDDKSAIKQVKEATDKYGDGIADGWELYVMFGTNGVTNVVANAAMKPAATEINPWKYADRSLDVDGDALDLVNEYSDGKDPSDPWDPYSVYKLILEEGVIEEDTEPFLDSEVRRFGVKKDDIDDDWDLDMISNGQEVWGYYKDRKSLYDTCETNAWSDGFTPDYFRALTNLTPVTYLGEIYNGAEFIEPKYRKDFGLLDESKAGTRAMFDNGWDVWSIVRYMGMNESVDGEDQVALMNILLKYMTIKYPSFSGATLDEIIKFLAEKYPKRLTDGDWSGRDLVTINEVVEFLGGVDYIKDEIRKNGVIVETPEPRMYLTLSYAGNGPQSVWVEAYQVNPSRPDIGEQLTAKWNIPADFKNGMAIDVDLGVPSSGALVQGPARFVAYIDVDGDSAFSTADIFGTAEINVGYIGDSIDITLGRYNTALPLIKLRDDASNQYQTVAIVRTMVNGEYITAADGSLAPRGVILRKYWNNIGREILYPTDYIDDDFIGLDKYLASDYAGDENYSSIESVTYEIVGIKPSMVKDLEEDVSTISVSNLNHYTYVEVVETADGGISNITHVVDQARNAQLTVYFPMRRDVPKNVIVDASATGDDYFISFEVPDDGYAVTKFFIELDGAPFGDPDGYLLPPITGNKVILRRDWIEKNCGVIPAGEHRVTVALGNDKFPESPDQDEEWSASAVFVMNAAKVSDGKIFIQVKHPLTNFTGNVTIAAYEKGDLAQPVRTWTGKATDEVYTLDNLKKNGQYYIAAWYVKNAADGRAGATERKPHDTWGYYTSIGVITNGFDAASITALVKPTVTNTFWMQDTDWNDNSIIDRLENIKAVNGVREIDENYYSVGDLDMDGVADVDDDDPVFNNGDEVLENDVMAYAEVKVLCVQLGSMNDSTNWVWYAVLDPESEDAAVKVADPVYIPRGTKAEDIKSLYTTYIYGKKTSKLFGLGTNVVDTASLAGLEVKNYEYKYIALVHGQVYQRYGFNPNTANGLISRDQWVNTKNFTKKDKYFVTNYLAAVGAIVDPNTYTNWVLNAKQTDFDFDGIPDGWELYTMFGTNAVKALTKSVASDVINPWVRDDRNGDPDGDGLVNFQEYNAGETPTDPWSAVTYDYGDAAITDRIAFDFGFRQGYGLTDDDDNDGLSNWAEYLATVAGYGSFDVKNAFSVTPNVLDYFVKTPDGRYVGEALDADGYSMIADHDFMEDAWEDLWDPSDVFPYALYANRYVYDANLDGDEDGWSNWAECRAYYWGCGFYSDIIDTFIGGQVEAQLRCFPKPAIGLHVTYNGRLDDSWRSLIVRTRTAKSNYPDAIFQIDSLRKAANGGNSGSGTGGSDSSGSATNRSSTATLGGQEKTQLLGVYHGARYMRGYLNPGLVVPHSVKFELTSVSQELIYQWHCTECNTSGITSYDPYMKHIQTHGEAKTDPDNKGVVLDKTRTSDWELFAFAGGGLDGRHGQIFCQNSGVQVGEIDYRTGEYWIDLGSLSSAGGWNFEGMAIRSTYAYNLGANFPQTIWLSYPEKGYVKEGRNTIEAFIDLDEDGMYDVGEPYGVLRDVDIGWQKTPELRIELADGLDAGVPLFTIESENDAEQISGFSRIADGTVKGAELKVDTTKINVLADDEENADETAGETSGENVGTGVASFAIMPRGNGMGCLRIVRKSINGRELKFERAVYVKNIDVTYGKVFTVGDFIQNGQIDLDSKFLVTDAEAEGIPADEIVSVEYAVCWGEKAETLFTFTRTFDGKRVAPQLVRGDEDSYFKLLKAQPELTWIGGVGYSAYAVQVSEDENFGSVLYAATNILPAAGSDGITFKPDLYVGEELKDRTTYYWRVAQLNAKFTENDWSEVGSFSTAVDSKNADTGYGKLAAEVRYYGPSEAPITNVVVGVYESGDFRCAPVARMRLTGDSTVVSLANEPVDRFLNLSTNVVFDGIAPGEYYVMAFVDANGNGVRDAYETWGYACKIGTWATDVWTPVTATVVSEKKTVPQVLVVMEDTDVNQDMIPDCLEEFTDVDIAQDVIPDEDSDGDGAPDDYEETNGFDPYNPEDAGYEIAGDVMAYEDVPGVLLVKIGGSWYAVMDPNGESAKLRDSDIALQTYARDIDSLVTTWTMGEYVGIGRRVRFTGDEKVLATMTTSVRLIHAQVYAKNGFNPLTANAQAYAEGTAVNTKPFTPRDKFLVCRYLENIGVAGVSEEEMFSAVKAAMAADADTTRIWSMYTLDPNAVDGDHDDIDDGWELYTMLGVTDLDAFVGTAFGEFSEIRISPFNVADGMLTAPGSGSRLKLVEEFDGGYYPTDPWAVDTDRDGVGDYYAYEYHLKGGFAGMDFDGDGLSNYAEYLISEVFHYGMKLNPEEAYTADGVLDYFRRMGDLYLGEIFTDHDQVNDVWEARYPGAASTGRYDPEADPDGDGWSNFAEAAVGTDPMHSDTVGIDGNSVPEHPVPTIAATVLYNGHDSITEGIVFKAWNAEDGDGAKMLGVPDAIWTAPASVVAESGDGDNNSGNSELRNPTKYLGKKPSTTYTQYLGPGAVVPSTVRVYFRDLDWKRVMLRGGKEVSSYAANGGDSSWFAMIQDNGAGVLYTSITNRLKQVAVGSVDYATGRITVNFGDPVFNDFVYASTSTASSSSTDEGGSTTVESVAYNYAKLNLAESYVKIGWTRRRVGTTGTGTYYLSDPDAVSAAPGMRSNGYIREGKNNFIVYVDKAGNGTYVPGAPLGFVRDVEVGWSGAKFTVELSETSAITPRIDAWTDTSDRGATYDKLLNTALQDRTLDEAGRKVISNVVQTATASADKNVSRLRVVRFGVNGMYAYLAGCEQRVLVDEDYNSDARNFIFEGDFLRDGEYDLDWSYFADEINRGSIIGATGDITNLTYLVVLEGGQGCEHYIRSSWDSNTVIRALSTTIERRFEKTRHKPVVDSLGVIYSGRPTFTWSIPDEEKWAKQFGSSYTAFRLQICETNASHTVVFDSGVQYAPAVNAKGKFEWTAPVCAGETTALGKVFKSSGNWTFRVAMYNAKFQPSDIDRYNYWSDYGVFSTAVNAAQPMNDNGYSSISAAVRYTGPVTVLDHGTVVVEAYDSPDFTGDPIAVTTATDKVGDAIDLTANSTLIGIPAVGTYYVRAFIDLNGNRVRDDWESWGASDAVYIDTALVTAPEIGLFIEDADTDNDHLPDAYEYVTAGGTGTWESVKDRLKPQLDTDGKLVFSTEIANGILNGVAGVSSGITGANVTLFQDPAFVSLMFNTILGGGTKTLTMDDIRKAVNDQMSISDNTLKITAFTFDAENGKVTMYIDADVQTTTAGSTLARLYDISTDTVTVKVNVYRRDSLASVDGWVLMDTEEVTFGRNQAVVNVDVPNIDKNGFYKVEVVR